MKWIEFDLALYPRTHVVVDGLTLRGLDPIGSTRKFWKEVAPPIMAAICGNCKRSDSFSFVIERALA